MALVKLPLPFVKSPIDDSKYFAKRSCMIPLQYRMRCSSTSLSSCSGIFRGFSVFCMHTVVLLYSYDTIREGYASNARTLETLFLNESVSFEQSIGVQKPS